MNRAASDVTAEHIRELLLYSTVETQRVPEGHSWTEKFENWNNFPSI